MNCMLHNVYATKFSSHKVNFESTKKFPLYLLTGDFWLCTILCNNPCTFLSFQYSFFTSFCEGKKLTTAVEIAFCSRFGSTAVRAALLRASEKPAASDPNDRLTDASSAAKEKASEKAVTKEASAVNQEGSVVDLRKVGGETQATTTVAGSDKGVEAKPVAPTAEPADPKAADNLTAKKAGKGTQGGANSGAGKSTGVEEPLRGYLGPAKSGSTSEKASPTASTATAAPKTNARSTTTAKSSLPSGESRSSPGESRSSPGESESDLDAAIFADGAKNIPPLDLASSSVFDLRDNNVKVRSAGSSDTVRYYRYSPYAAPAPAVSYSSYSGK